jgi:hypothetical protein
MNILLNMNDSPWSYALYYKVKNSENEKERCGV